MGSWAQLQRSASSAAWLRFVLKHEIKLLDVNLIAVTLLRVGTWLEGRYYEDIEHASRK